ncbi:DEAD/DEAH box helicase [Rhizobium sp. CBN3]|uniref:DEAD/DEAH box helicase n=1 Tax=Rhizobium sp. CBN3 TaxID=3058045 RepID=UPI002670DE6D|nr:DEAD/DEAH box helicase [Rhizobium sp. CBN3]MDO3431137.1 DEAD/DEAH box helicase [Rhizobium sp. CBN3]
MTSLRPYQETAVVSALDALTRSGSVVLQMPTGAGKTRTAAEIVKRSSGVVWFICHRQEIERQTAEAFRKAGIDFGIISPRASPDYGKGVQIVSVAVARLDEIPNPSLVIWDECHHVPAESWAELHRKLATARHLGLTATPERLDGKGLKDWFSALVIGPSISELVLDGYLSPFRYFAPSDPDLTAAKLQAGDYRKKDTDAAMNTPVLIGDAVAEYRRSANGKRAIAFCTSVEASKALVDRFNRDDIAAIHVDGKSSDDERRAAIDAFTSGEVKILSNVDVFTEGFDVPGIEAVILMRPTRSTTLLLQMIGRALRPVGGKTAIIMDHAGLHRDHGWFAREWDWSIDGGAARTRRMGGDGVRRCPECKEVRGERVEACACGYEFPTGREIGEYDGVLHEVSGDVPDGCVTQAEFARLVGAKSSSSPQQWAKKGMPMHGAYVPVSDAVAWLSLNPPSSMPPIGIKNADEYESQAAFARRSGWSQGRINKLVASGEIPSARNGWIHIQDGLNAIAKRTIGRPPSDVDDPENYEPVHKFFRERLGRWNFRSSKFACLPRASNGWVHIPTAMQIAQDRGWIKGTFDRKTHETKTQFAKRIGRAPASVTLYAKSGLPCDAGGRVSILSGLEWVRDNTNVAIPPEAWPTANDNEKKHHAAA